MKRMDPAAGRTLVAAYQRSSKRMNAFCEERGVSYAVLKYWHNRLEEIDEKAKDQSTFVQIATPASAPSRSHSEIPELNAAAIVVLPNNVRIAFRQSTDVTIDVIKALTQC